MAVSFSVSKKFIFLPFAQLYFSFSILFGTWVIHIPGIIEKLKMSESQLGMALFCAAAGSLISIPFGNHVMNKYGEGRVSFYIILSISLNVIAIFVVPGYYWLCVALFIFGINVGFLKIGVNSLVASVEREKNISIMSACHGFFSIGGMLSAGLGTLLLITLKNPLHHILLAAALVVTVQIFFRKQYYTFKNQTVKNKTAKKIRSIKNRNLWGLAIIAMLVMVAEGAIADWSGIFLKDVALTKSEFSGLGYAGFSLSMTMGRLSGDYLSNRYGAWQIILGGYFTSIIGFSIILTEHPFVSILGFFVVGLGFSIIIPETYRLSANVKGVDPSSGIALMAGVSSLGFLIGPVALGTIAEYYGLTTSFVVLLNVLIMGTLLTVFFRNRYSKKYPPE